MPKILILISILIVLFLFVGASLIFNKNRNAENKKYKEIEQKTNKMQIEYSVRTFTDQTINLFKNYNKDYVEDVESNNISVLNKKYKKEIESILSSPEVKTIVANELEEEIKKIETLKKISEESPFTWLKKFKKEMEEFNA